MKLKFKRKLPLILALIMALFVVVPPATVSAADAGSVNVDFYATWDGVFPFTKETINVTDGLAEEYGYQVATEDHNGNPVTGPTVMDVLVAAHIAKYGDAFTKETATDYLTISSSGMLRKVFERDAMGDLGFWIDDQFPQDDNGTGYNADTAVVVNGQKVVLWKYLSEYWGDYYTHFDQEYVTIDEGESVTLNLQGTMALAFGQMPYEAIYSEAGADGLAIVLVDPDTGDVETIPGATTDEEGNVTLEFDTAGVYHISANGFDKSGNWPIVPPWCTVMVNANPPVIIEGAGNTWTKGSDTGLSFTSDAAIDDFLWVEVDGEEIAEDYYTEAEGSTVVTLKPAYLETLRPGTHVMGIVSTNGTAETEFTIVAAVSPQPGDGTLTDDKATAGSVKTVKSDKTPKTGDSFPMAPIGMLIIAGAAVTIILSRNTQQSDL